MKPTKTELNKPTQSLQGFVGETVEVQTADGAVRGEFLEVVYIGRDAFILLHTAAGPRTLAPAPMSVVNVVKEAAR